MASLTNVVTQFSTEADLQQVGYLKSCHSNVVVLKAPRCLRFGECVDGHVHKKSGGFGMPWKLIF